MGASFVPYANGSGAVSMASVHAFSLYQGCSSFDACLPLASEGTLAASLVVTALVVTRNFGWRAYRKFGATLKGTRLKEVYRTRKLFASFLKIDVVLAILQLIGTLTYMFNPYVWPDSHPIAPFVLLGAVLMGLGWAIGIYQAVHSESGRFSILLTPLGLLHPICLAGGLVILIKYQQDRSVRPAAGPNAGRDPPLH